MIGERIALFVLTHAWAIAREVRPVMAEAVARRLGGTRLSAEEVQQRLEAAARPRDKANQAPGNIAVLPVYGLIMHRAYELNDVSSPGGASTEAFGAAFRSAMRDTNISAVVIDINSPGGTVDGVPELAAEIRAARGSKPIVAWVNSLAASAAFWIATAADEIVVTPSGAVGSIGVYGLHDDISQAMAEAGVKTTLVSAGKYKVEGNAYEPLSDEARAAMQSQVDAFYSMFVRDVAKGRGVQVEAVRNGFGEGRVVLAKDAVAAGMADRVDTFDGVIAGISKRLNGAAPVARALDASPANAELLLEDQKPMRLGLAADAEGAEPPDRCPGCNGSGLTPERAMSDPEGQKPCQQCGGSGKVEQGPDTVAIAADLDQAAAGITLAEARQRGYGA